MRAMTVEDLLEIANDPDEDIANSVMHFTANLRGTRGYWRARCSELIQMVRTLGAPTAFFTLSAADYHWQDLYRILCPGTDPASLNETMRCDLMHKNPSTVAWFFKERVNAFVNLFLKKFFKIREFWFRYEWQFRGSPHVHGLLWFDESPNIKNIDAMNQNQKDAIIRFFDPLVRATIGQPSLTLPISSRNNPCRRRFTDLNPQERSSDLNNLLWTVQRHSKCGSHCRRKDRRTGRFVCRFGFPIETQNESTLVIIDGAWRFMPKRNDNLVQKYNPYMMMLWRANIDFSAITSIEAVLAYIAKYAAKQEKQSIFYSEVLANILQRHDPQTSAVTVIRQLILTSVAERNFSAQEVIHLIEGWPLYSSSRSYVVLSLKDDYQLYRSNSTSFLERYAQRDDELSETSLHYFAEKYYIKGERIVERRQSAIVRVRPFLKRSDDPQANEDYYRLQCQLHIPWRFSFDDMLPDGWTWQEFYMQHMAFIDEVEPFYDELPDVADGLADIDDDNDEHRAGDIVRDAAMAASRINPVAPAIDQLGHRIIDEAHEWSKISDSGLNEDEIQNFWTNYESIPSVINLVQSLIPFEQMSSGQKEVLSLCASQINNQNHQIRRVLVQGKAGTGKTAVIKAICNMIDEYFPSDNHGKPYLLLAPTGAAAVNVDGKTIHNGLRIPVNTEFERLSNINLRDFQLRFRRVRFIIIDEFSMIGLRLLWKIHDRLCQAKGSLDTVPFGGFFIYFFGDLRQLPPVLDLPVYRRSSIDICIKARECFLSIQKKIVLTAVHRQLDGQIRFKQILDSIAKGSVSESDWHILMTRRPAVLQQIESNQFKYAIRLFVTNDKVEQYNKTQLGSTGWPVARIRAEHNNDTARLASDDKAQGLQPLLYLSEGCRVMLRKNLSVAKGLVNGSLGTVRKVIYRDGEEPDSLPAVVMIQWDKFHGPYIQDELFPLLPITITWTERSVECTRKQFPIVVAHATTIHKSQGLTIDRAVVDIGPNEIICGLTYVALSRVRKLQDLILEPFDFSRIDGLKNMKQLIDREAFMREFGIAAD